MKKIVLMFLSVALLAACSSGKQEKTAEVTTKDSVSTNVASEEAMPPYMSVVGDSIEIAPFEVELTLSPKAAEKLKKVKETIIVNVEFMGIPKDTVNNEDYMTLGFAPLPTSRPQIELKSEDRIAKFSGVRISKKVYDAMANKDFEININTFSGRKSSQDNLLDGGFFQYKASKVMGQPLKLNIKLIEE
ncbi:MAG: hypothetical protein EAZ08_01985 [Cytophagales bacterium]|nr:MAG: hypothetical protein EAZ08_01985 [Cytophagales bacterium]